MFSAAEVSAYYTVRAPNIRQTTAREWRGACPIHSGKDANLTVELETGRWFCHSQCQRGGDIIDFERELTGADFRAARDEVFRLVGRAIPDGHKGGEWREVARYPYNDEEGRLLFEKIRRERGEGASREKRFRQRRPDGNRGWTWNVKGVRRVLYHLPEVLAASDVLVVEGEKDAEAAKAHGLTATTSGAVGTWRPEHSEALRGKRVAIIEDADERGHEHAQQVAASLAGKAACVKLLELPGAKDLSEWMEKGHSRGELDGLIAAATEWKATDSPSTPASRIRGWDDIPDVLTMPKAEVIWAVEGLIPAGAVTLIAGEPSSFKTWLALRLALGVAGGKASLGRACRPMDVLYLDAENPQAVVCERLEVLGAEPGGRLRIWGGWLPERPPALGDERLRAIAKERKPLIVFDSLIRFHCGDENFATEMAVTMQYLRELANLGATAVVLHHTLKSDSGRYRGSGDIAGGVDVAFSLRRDRENAVLILDCFKTRFTEEFRVTLRPDLEESGDFLITEAPDVTREEEEVARLRELIAAEPGLAQEAIVASAGLPKNKARSLLRRGEGKDWRMERGGRGARRYFPAALDQIVEIPL